jgi:phosphonoacetaldehyde hydrolase
MKCERLLNVYPPVTCVKIGDTVVDMEEGKNAGMWTIGLTRSGNAIWLDSMGNIGHNCQRQRRRFN